MGRGRFTGWIVLALLALGAFVGLTRPSEEDLRKRRLGALRGYALQADERAPRSSATDELWARLAELDRELQELAPAERSWLSLSDAWTPEALAEQRALLTRVEPCLAGWAELCASDELRERLGRGERISSAMPRFLGVQNWGELLAWRAYFQSRDPLLAARAAETLASVFDLAEAFDDRTLIAAMIRIAIEQRALVAARDFLEAGWLDARALRLALDPRLLRASSARGEALVLNEVRSLFELQDRSCADDAHADYAGDPAALDTLLEHLGSLESALELARLSAPEYHRARLERGTAGEPGRSFVNACSNAFDRLHRQRSFVALFRVALAIEEHRELTGALPGTLDELAASFPAGVPPDPLSAEPFPWRIESGRGQLGPTACPLHASAERRCDWSKLDELAAFEF